MLSADMSLVDLSALIDQRRGKAARAAYFQNVFENMYSRLADRNDVVQVRFGLTGEAFAPNYQIVRASDQSISLFWGTYHKACDADFPGGWEPQNLTNASFTLAEIDQCRRK